MNTLEDLNEFCKSLIEITDGMTKNEKMAFLHWLKQLAETRVIGGAET